MPRRRRPDTLPHDILPPDVIQRHDLVRRLYTGPFLGLTPRADWRPLTDAEWSVLEPLLPTSNEAAGGRPIADLRGRMDAILRGVTLKRAYKAGGGRAPWSDLPPAFGKPDTVSRTFRRWAAAGLWERLLRLVAEEARPSRVLRGLRYVVCCAYRRQGVKRLGLRGIALARRLGLYSALPAPSPWLPDPALSKLYCPIIARALNRIAGTMRQDEDGRWIPGWTPPKRAWRLFRSMLTLAGGRARITRSMEPA